MLRSVNDCSDYIVFHMLFFPGQIRLYAMSVRKQCVKQFFVEGTCVFPVGNTLICEDPFPKQKRNSAPVPYFFRIFTQVGSGPLNSSRF